MAAKQRDEEIEGPPIPATTKRPALNGPEKIRIQSRVEYGRNILLFEQYGTDSAFFLRSQPFARGMNPNCISVNATNGRGILEIVQYSRKTSSLLLKKQITIPPREFA